MWSWIAANHGWLVPLLVYIIIEIGNYYVSTTESEKDNNIWKAIVYILYKLLRFYPNKKKSGGSFTTLIYESEDVKPDPIKNFDRLHERIKDKLNKF